MSRVLQVANHPGNAAAILQIPHNLNERQKAFADFWLETRNGTESARRAGVPGDDNALAVYASKTLRIAKVQNYVTQNLKLSMMSADEVLKRLSKQGRADIADILTDSGEFDFTQAKKRGNTDLIRKMKIRKTRRIDPSTDEIVEETTHELELHNAQSALELMGKHHRLFADVVESSETITTVQRTELTIVLASALGYALELPAIDVAPGQNVVELGDGSDSR